MEVLNMRRESVAGNAALLVRLVTRIVCRGISAP